MKFTLSWLKDHLKTKATRRGDRDQAVGDRARGRERRGSGREARRIPRRAHCQAKQASQRRQAAGGAGRDRRRAGPRSRSCAARRTRARARRRVRAARHLHSGLEDHAREEAGARRRLERHDVLGAELELSAESDGIIELAPEMADHVGERYVDAMGLADPVIEVKLTPNRPDCTGVRGIARDLAAAGLGTLKPEKRDLGVEGADPCPIEIKLEFTKETRDACPVFAGRYVKGVKNGPSPAWLQTRLQGRRPAAHQRARRRHELHQPGSRPPAARLRRRQAQGRRSARGSARRARSSSASTARSTRSTRPCASSPTTAAPLGLGGVMGGEASGSHRGDDERADRERLLRSAAHRRDRAQDRPRDGCALPLRARRRSRLRAAGPRSRDADDPQALRRQAVARRRSPARCRSGAPQHRLRSGARREADGPQARRTARSRRSSKRSAASSRARAQVVKVTVPTWRPDMHGPADLVEEVVRIAGLDRVPSTPLPRTAGVARPVLTERQKRARRARRTLAARGLVEAVTWSFIPRAEAQGVRRRRGCARARQSDLDRDVVDAPEPAARPARGR